MGRNTFDGGISFPNLLITEQILKCQKYFRLKLLQTIKQPVILIQTIMRKILKQPTSAQNQPSTSKGYSEQRQRKCMCQWQKTPPVQSDTVICVNCYTIFHKKCFKITTDQFECPYCSLQAMDPLNQVVQCLSVCYLKDFINKTIQFSTSPARSSDEAIEIRCVRIDGENHRFQTWPDYGQIWFNSKRCQIIKPLGILVGQKKRRDYGVVVENFSSNNTVKFRFDVKDQYDPRKYKIGSYEHIVGIFKIRRLIPNQLVEKIKKNVLRIQKSQQFLKKNLAFSVGNDDLEIPQVKVSLNCSFTHSRIRIPVKGKFCKHLACFDLTNAIHLNMHSKKWLCPICQQKITQMFVDPTLLDIIESNPNAVGVSFFKNNEVKIINQQLHNSDSQQAPPVKKKLKVENKNEIVMIDCEDFETKNDKQKTYEEKQSQYSEKTTLQGDLTKLPRKVRVKPSTRTKNNSMFGDNSLFVNVQKQSGLKPFDQEFSGFNQNSISTPILTSIQFYQNKLKEFAIEPLLCKFNRFSSYREWDLIRLTEKSLDALRLLDTDQQL